MLISFAKLVCHCLSMFCFVVAIIVSQTTAAHATTTTTTTTTRHNQLPPVILIPGSGGSQMYAILNKSESSYFYCSSKTDDHYLLWLRPEYFVYPFINCFLDNIRLEFDPLTKTTKNPDGVNITISGWGHTHSVEFLSTLRWGVTSYYHQLVNNLVNQLNYVRGYNIRSAPFDFRKAPNELTTYFASLKRLIEETYVINGFTPVVLIAHSFGCLNTHYFLSKQTQQWKNQFIDSFISTGGPIGGTMMSVLIMTSGYDLGSGLFDPLRARDCQRSWPSVFYMLPRQRVWMDSVLVNTTNQTYTAKDYQQLFQDIEYPIADQIHQAVFKNDVDQHQGPGVRTYCIFSKGIPTVESLQWTEEEGNFPDSKPKQIMNDGDGTVSWKSLKVCSEWSKTQSQVVETKIFDGIEHVELIQSENYIEFVRNVLQRDNFCPK